MTSFTVHGPFPVNFQSKKGGRTLDFKPFWSEGAAAQYLAGECGCYTFAIRSGPGLQPIYVGKATRTFEQETFNPTNKHKYHNGFSDYGKGTPVMYFVVHPNQRGRTNTTRIAKIEDFLIQAGVAKNPNIQNVRGASQPKWSIKGAVRGGAGKRTQAETQFSRLFGITAK